MTKTERGKNIKKIPNWRGTCPICGRKRVKLAWSAKDSAGNKVNVCKLCFSKSTDK